MKILNKLTLKNLKLNRSRTIVTIIAIVLSTALITIVAGIGASQQQTMIDSQLYYTGDFDLSAMGSISKDDISDLKANRDVKDVYITDAFKIAKMPENKSDAVPYLYIRPISANAYGTCFKTELVEGRYPKNDKEIVLSEKIYDKSNLKFKLGDTIKLEYGTRMTPNGEEIDSYDIINPQNLGQSEKTQEKLKVSGTKEYKIVGIMRENLNYTIASDSFMPCVDAYTAVDENSLSDLATLYVRYTDEGEKDLIRVTSQVVGVPESIASRATSNSFYLSKIELNEYKDTLKFDGFNLNVSLLQYKGYIVGGESLGITIAMVIIITGIIILISYFIIRNSFSISIIEKNKLYGMLSSIGATSKQIRNNIFYEGFVLGLIGIPIGILLGIGIVALLIVSLNIMMADAFMGFDLGFSMPLIAIVFAAISSIVTIFISTLGIAVTASRISPIEAIRSNLDVKVGRKSKKKENYKSPKFIKKVFGVGGDIAYKNLKRSKKKYRSTIVSIIIGVASFIAISAFVTYALMYSSNLFGVTNYNVSVSDYSGVFDWKEIDEKAEKVLSIKGIESYRRFLCATAMYEYDEKLLTEDAANCNKWDYEGNAPSGIVALDNDTFEALAKEAKVNISEAKKKPFFINVYSYQTADKEKAINIFKEDSIKKLTLTRGEEKIPVEISAMFDYVPTNIKDLLYYNTNIIVVSLDWMKENVDNSNQNYDITHQLYVNATDASEFEEAVNSLGELDLFVYNIEFEMNMINTLILAVSIFIYGFIVIISLIGITNIFNTITTNMKLRSKEFAMLKSVGMTSKEFNRMIRLESIFYGLKSLIFGVPIGLALNYLIYYAFDSNQPDMLLKYSFPFLEVLISIVFVFSVVWMIMRYSISKVKKQNIIETIRNDNI
ncbi:MAG: ABC transporter permease [Ruminococcus sp.]|nr:ABC transporter permease [Ruminococcus sp.]